MFDFCLDEDLRFARYLMFDKINFKNLVIPMILCDYVLGISYTNIVTVDFKGIRGNGFWG